MERQLSNIKTLLIDLDGTVYFKNSLIRNVNDTIKILRNHFNLKFLTNTDSMDQNLLHKKMINMGLLIEKQEIYSSIDAIFKFIKANKGITIFPLVNKLLKPLFEDLCIINEDNPDYVVITDFRDNMSFELINRAFRYLNNGSGLLTGQKGKFFYSEQGISIDTGAFVQLLEYASGKEAKILGKPSKEFFLGALKEFGTEPKEALVIGDDVTTDIVGGNKIGAISVLVKTGKFNPILLDQSEEKPTYILESINELQKYL